MAKQPMRLNVIAAAYLVATIVAVSPAAAQDFADAPEDPNSTRLLFGPTARTLPKGDVTLGIHSFVLPSVQVGITDRFSVGGGTPLLFPLPASDRPYWITPKLQVLNHGNTRIALGVVQTLNLSGVGVAYAVMTTGTSRRSVTAGAGVAYTGDGGRQIAIMAGGDRQVRRSMKFVTENYYFAGQGVLSAGVRFFDERKSLDAAVAAPINGYFYGLVPMVNFVYRF
jgi:hypothetical protein